MHATKIGLGAQGSVIATVVSSAATKRLTPGQTSKPLPHATAAELAGAADDHAA